jgi:outer membrane biosynthesis protein TonB
LIRPPEQYGAAKPRARQIGIAISIVLHLLLLLFFMTRKNPIKITPPASPEGAMVYISPLPVQPKALPTTKPEPAKPSKPSKPTPAKSKPTPPRQQKQAVTTPTPPAQQRQEVVVPPVQSQADAPPPPQESDMSERIAKRQAARAAARAEDAQSQSQDSQPAAETDDQRANRIARANIAGAQGATSGQKNDGGGVFSIANKTYRSADIKFRGWNTNFKRTWSQQVTVERGDNPDIETAIIKKMVELIRKEKPGDFVWESHRLGRNVNMSARVSDQPELEAFLMKEFFPDYKK